MRSSVPEPEQVEVAHEHCSVGASRKIENGVGQVRSERMGSFRKFRNDPEELHWQLLVILV